MPATIDSFTTAPLLYLRASSDPRETLSSVSDQKKSGLRMCEAHGWPTPKVFTDNDMTGSNEDRPEWIRLKKELNRRRVPVLMAFTSSRLTRERRAFLDLCDLLTSRGTKLCIDGKLYDPADPTDIFQLATFNNFDAYWLDMIRKNTKQAMDSNAEQGKPHGRVPFGYVRVRDERTGRVITQEPHPTEAPQYQRWAAGVLKGTVTLTDIATEAGITMSSVRRLLTNPTYIGQRVHRAGHDDMKVYEGNWKPLITVDQHRALIRLFERNAMGPRSTPLRRHPYSGLLVCSECGVKLHMRTDEGKGGSLRYMCANRRCRKVSVRYDVFRPWFEALLNDAIVRAVKVTGNPADDTSDLTALRAKYDRLVARRENLIDTFDDEDDDPAALKALLAKNKAAIAAVEADIDALTDQFDSSALLDENGHPIDLTADHITDDVRTRIASRLVNTVTVHPLGKGRRLTDITTIIGPDDVDWR